MCIYIYILYYIYIYIYIHIFTYIHFANFTKMNSAMMSLTLESGVVSVLKINVDHLKK